MPSSAFSTAPAGSTSVVLTVTVPSIATSNSISVVTHWYPSGAFTSVSLYVPGSSLRSIVSPVLEVHSLTVLPSESVTLISAPSISLIPPMSVLLIDTSYSLSLSLRMILPSLSFSIAPAGSTLVVFTVTSPFSATVNLISVVTFS